MRGYKAYKNVRQLLNYVPDIKTEFYKCLIEIYAGEKET